MAEVLSPSKRRRVGVVAADADAAPVRDQCPAAPAPQGAAAAAAASEFATQAVSFLSSRLADCRCRHADTLRLRPSLQKVHDDLVSVLGGAVQLRQNASLLLVGEPGIGKTAVLERVLRTACVQHNSDAENPSLGVVRLSGVLHCEERAAFQEIAHQLCSTFGIPFSRSASFSDNLSFFKEVLAELQRAFKTVVFVIDQLEAFMRGAKQTLLYNVLDALQHSQVQAVVLGVSCSFDVQDMMEKRVRSRFSNRKVFLPGLALHKEGDESAAAVLSSMLQLPDGYAPAQRAKQHNAAVQRAMGSACVEAAMQEVCAVGVTPRELGTAALACLSAWEAAAAGAATIQAQGLQPQHLVDALRGLLGQHDSRVEALLGLSVLELCMLVAAQRLEDKGSPEFNFEMLLDEFMSVQQMQLGHMWNKAGAWRAFRDVVDQGLVAFTAARPGSKGMMQRYLPAQLRVAKGELARAVAGHPSCPDFVGRWLRGDAVGGTLALS